MLSNAYFLAKFRFDTAENEPAKNLQKFANFADPNPLTRKVSPVDVLPVKVRELLRRAAHAAEEAALGLAAHAVPEAEAVPGLDPDVRVHDPHLQRERSAKIKLKIKKNLF